MKSLFAFACLTTIAFSSGLGAAELNHSQQLQAEFRRMREAVMNFTPDGEVAEYLKFKRFKDHEVLWRLREDGNDYDVIRIFREKPSGETFVVSYYHAEHIVPGRSVIRRFYGPGQTGWRNDTIDATTGEYLGRQGAEEPLLDRRDLAIMRQWKIQPF